MQEHLLRPRGERGAILIHIAFGLLALLAFTAFAVDMGVLWVSRNQAQNAADAAALAAATSLAFDTPSGDQARATAVAQAVGARNAVWGSAPDIRPEDVTFPPCPPGAPGPVDTCVRVAVYRNQGRDPLPTFFARLVGVNQQGVRASATAQVLITNESDCVKPWMVADKWLERYPVVKAWQPTDTFDLFYSNGNNKGAPLPTPDVYIPPYNADGSANANTTGFRIEGDNNDRGVQLTLKPGNPQNATSPGWFFPVDLPRPSGPITGGDVYRENIQGCNGMVIKPGDLLQNEPGDMIGPTKQGVDALVALDPNAEWDGSKVIHSDFGENGSPRMVALPVFNVDAYERGRASGRTVLVISNVLGFFIEGMQGNNVVGVLTHKPTLKGSMTTNPEAAFLRTVILVR